MQPNVFQLTACAAAFAAASTSLAQPVDSASSTPVSTGATFSPDSNRAPVTQMSTIVVTPARMAEPLAATLGDNSVISREELDTIPNATLAEALGLTRHHSQRQPRPLPEPGFRLGGQRYQRTTRPLLVEPGHAQQRARDRGLDRNQRQQRRRSFRLHDQ